MLKSKYTAQDLAKEFERLVAFGKDPFFTDGKKWYMNSYAFEDEFHLPDEKDEEKYQTLQVFTSKLTRIIEDILMVVKDGCCTVDFDVARELQNMGYKVYPTDQDSFGWLCGAIEKDNFIMCFG